MIDFATFPWSYPDIFTKILVYTENYQTVLNTRVVCQGWQNWLAAYKPWIKFLKYRRSKFCTDLSKIVAEENSPRYLIKYRLGRLIFSCTDHTLSELEALKLLLKIEAGFRQLRENKIPVLPSVSTDTMWYLEDLQKLERDDEKILSIGPISLFIRIKVSNPLVMRVVTEILSRILTCIVVDSTEKENPGRMRYYVRGMSNGQNWIFRDIQPRQINQYSHILEIYASEEDALKALDAHQNNKQKQANGALNQPAANPSQKEEEQPSAKPPQGDQQLPQSTQSANGAAKQTLKRKRSPEEENHCTQKCSKLEGKLDENGKTNEDGATDNGKEEEAVGDEDYDEGDGAQDIYRTRNPVVSENFPTILELLDIDHPVIEKTLINKFNIDRVLVVPKLEEFILNQEKYAKLIPKGMEIAGWDQDGNVSKIDPEKDFVETDNAVMGYMEKVQCLDLGDQHLLFWRGADIRHRWKEFERQLTETGEEKHVRKEKRFPPSSLLNLETSSSTCSYPLDDIDAIDAMLEARGISVTRSQSRS